MMQEREEKCWSAKVEGLCLVHSGGASGKSTENQSYIRMHRCSVPLRSHGTRGSSWQSLRRETISMKRSSRRAECE